MKNLQDLASQAPFSTHWTGVMAVGVQDPENLGLIARTCSALGIQDLILGPDVSIRWQGEYCVYRWPAF